MHSDLAARKKALPVVAALTSGTPSGAQLMELYHRDTYWNAQALERAVGLIEAAGGRVWAQADHRLHTTLGLLTCAP